MTASSTALRLSSQPSRNALTSWLQATDEVYDLARTSLEFLDEYDDVKVEAVDFATLELPLNGTVYAARPFGTTTT